MRGIEGFRVINGLVVIALVTLLVVVLLPALQRIHAVYSADAGAEASLEAMDRSGPARTLLEEDAGANYNIQKSGSDEECWLVIYDPDCDHQVIVFKTLAPASGDDQTM